MKPLKARSQKPPDNASKPALPHPVNQVIRFQGPLLKGEEPERPQPQVTPSETVIPPALRELLTGRRISEAEKNLLIDAPWRQRVRGYNITRPQDPK